MSIRSLVETVVYLDNFLNVDLYSQGYYFVRIQLYTDRADLNLVSIAYLLSNPRSCAENVG